MLIVSIVAGAVAGALLRYLGGLALPGPWGTLAVNVVGSALLGAFLAVERSSERPDPLWRALVGAGFCGSFTTFSTFALDVHALASRRELPLAAGYVAATLAAGLAAAWIGQRALRGVASVRFAGPPPLLSASVVAVAITSAAAWRAPAEAAAVAVGGSLGALARAGVGALLAPRARAWVTVAINLSGSALLGLLHGAAPSAHGLHLLLGTGFLGGYTTFSTFTNEVLEAERPFLLGLVSVAGSLGLCALGSLLGARLG